MAVTVPGATPIAVPMQSTFVVVALVIAGYYVMKMGITPSRYLEILGFWTPAFVLRRLEQLPNLILCIDADRNCGETDLEDHPSVVRYRRRIDPQRVLQRVA